MVDISLGHRLSGFVTPLSLRETALAGLVAAAYAVLTLAFYPISFAVYQVRIAEALTVLPFMIPAAVPGLFIGCVLANIFGGMGWQDIVFGSLLTLGAAYLTRRVASMPPRRIIGWVAMAPVLLLWAGGLALLNAFRTDTWVIAAVIVSALTAHLAAWLWKDVGTRRTVGAGCVIVSAAALAGAVLMAAPHTETKTLVIGTLALLTAGVLALVVAARLQSGDDPRLLLAPLPPVLLNAFGVSLYLAPIAGYSYWFSVQMVGIGQLIACYLLGLPLLRLMRSRRFANLGLTAG